MRILVELPDAIVFSEISAISCNVMLFSFECEQRASCIEYNDLDLILMRRFQIEQRRKVWRQMISNNGSLIQSATSVSVLKTLIAIVFRNYKGEYSLLSI